MNIQISVTLWTVICFVLLMVILRNLLFKPMLKVMDARRDRLENAAAKKAERETAEAEHKVLIEQKRAEYIRDRRKQIKDDIENIRQESKKTVDAEKEERLRLVDEYRAKLEEEHDEILGTLRGHTGDIAAIFADSLTKE